MASGNYTEISGNGNVTLNMQGQVFLSIWLCFHFVVAGFDVPGTTVLNLNTLLGYLAWHLDPMYLIIAAVARDILMLLNKSPTS